MGDKTPPTTAIASTPDNPIPDAPILDASGNTEEPPVVAHINTSKDDVTNDSGAAAGATAPDVSGSSTPLDASETPGKSGAAGTPGPLLTAPIGDAAAPPDEDLHEAYFGETFEYKVVGGGNMDEPDYFDTLQAQLNAAGAQGYRLATTFPLHGRVIAILGR